MHTLALLAPISIIDTLTMALVWVCYTVHIIQNYRIFGELQVLILVFIVDYLWVVITALFYVVLMSEPLIKSFGISCNDCRNESEL